MKLQVIKHTLTVFFAMVLLVQCQATNEDGLYRQSDYIFQGQVVQTNASNQEYVEKAANTHVVEVNKIIHASDGHEDFLDNNITVVTDREKSAEIEEGAEYIFYTKTWLFGSSLAVISNEINPDISQFENVRTNFTEFQNRMKSQQLRARLAQAEVVVLGTVGETRPTDVRRPVRETEHDPEWVTAVVEIQELLKGDVQDETIRMNFAGSDDVQWYRAPKFQQGQTGIFLLNRVDNYFGLEQAYIITDPEDYLQETALDSVKNILSNE